MSEEQKAQKEGEAKHRTAPSASVSPNDSQSALLKGASRYTGPVPWINDTTSSFTQPAVVVVAAVLLLHPITSRVKYV